MIPGSHQTVIDSWAPQRGIQFWRNRNGFAVVQLHYSAFPERDEEWAAKHSREYPGGRQGKLWRREQELDWGAWSGSRVYEEFDRSTHVISMRPEDIPPEWARFRAIDPGYNAPCGVMWVACDGDGVLYVYDELYERKKTVREMASLIKAKTRRQEFQFTLLDPNDGFKQTQAGSGATIAEQFAQEGIVCNPWTGNKRVGMDAVAQALKIRDDGQANLRVLEHCRNTIFEFENYRYMEIEEEKKDLIAVKEKPIDVHDHLMACALGLVDAIGNDYMSRHRMLDPHSTRKEVVSVTKQAWKKVAARNLRRRREEEGWYDD